MAFDFTKLPDQQAPAAPMSNARAPAFSAGGLVLGAVILLGAAGLAFFLISRGSQGSRPEQLQDAAETPWWTPS